MKLKQEFVLRNIGGDYVLIPIAKKEDEFQGIISLNETGVFIWNRIEENKNEEQIIKELLDEYDVSKEQATRNVKDFCENLKDMGIIM